MELSRSTETVRLTKDILNRLTACLLMETDRITELQALLQEEPVILASHDPQAIIALSNRKQNLADQLSECETSRRSYLAEIGLPMNLNDLEKNLHQIGAEESAAACQRLKKIASLCAEYNRNNGILVENRLRYVLQALHIVMGRSAEPDIRELTYGQRQGLGQRNTGRALAKV